jgi:hypothetical protein
MLQNIMENVTLYGSKTDAMKASVDYLVYQYLTAARGEAGLDALTTYVRRQRYLPAAEALSKLSIDETKNVVEETSGRLSSNGLASQHDDSVACAFGARPELFLQLDRVRLRDDFQI